MYTVYQISNKIKNRVYIGCSKHFETRINGHRRKSSNLFLRKDIKKYGWENFEVQILGKSESESEARQIEYNYITEFDMNPDVYVYNNQKGNPRANELRKLDEDAMWTHQVLAKSMLKGGEQR